MRLWWGNYAFPTNAAEVTSRTGTEFNYSGFPLRYVITVAVKVTLDGDGQEDLSDAEDEMRAALAVPYQNLILKTDSGNQSSARLITSSSITGVRLKSGPNFGEAQGAEFVNRRTCEFEMEAEYMIRGAENAVVSWRETVSIVGNGGPRRTWRFPLNANPIRQQVTKNSLVRATQSGEAIGHTRTPRRPLPIWPKFVVNESDGGTVDTPEPKGRAYLNYPVKWSYSFESGYPLVGLPSLPPMR